ncbi:CLUMA_CG007271, isoform A [Clunio marinus]|uniref:CLUMA_CG007271, isoform A n=1 Tax=Clunio marinus TaxID=568069 RepID=A0A1J1I062_9DIPT|nr:CLUMA_CG007271, isoform A [Clunio marinus]
MAIQFQSYQECQISCRRRKEAKLNGSHNVIPWKSENCGEWKLRFISPSITKTQVSNHKNR